MAVYTQLGSEDVAALLQHYDVGELVAMKGIAEGVQNSNFYIETTQNQFILTLYENQVDPADLPFFYALLAHLHEAGCKVPRFIADRNGQWLQQVGGRPACLIEFLSGVSVTHPTAAQAYSTGAALGDLHKALADFAEVRANALGVDAWRPLADQCSDADLNNIAPGLAQRIRAECDYVEEHWPRDLPLSAIHADLFPDNVLMLGDAVTGLIDFYFACTDTRGYDLAITHSAWAFSGDGQTFYADVSDALLHGYSAQFPIDVPTRDVLPVLLRGACLRFLLTRCYDWINTPANALVTRKDPLAYLRRLEFYSDDANVAAMIGQLQ
ncbi:MAG: homoserine kinase [Sphingorhabdus sp.]